MAVCCGLVYDRSQSFLWLGPWWKSGREWDVRTLFLSCFCFQFYKP